MTRLNLDTRKVIEKAIDDLRLSGLKEPEFGTVQLNSLPFNEWKYSKIPELKQKYTMQLNFIIPKELLEGDD